MTCRLSSLAAIGLVLFLAGCPADTTSPGDDAGVDAHVSDGGGVDAMRACTSAATCDDGVYCNGTETCSPAGVCAAGTPPHCDDGIACTVDACVEARRTCQSTAPDANHDGYADASCHDNNGVPLGTDCDDMDANRFPGNTEVCDTMGHDEDCNLTTVGTRDMDLDGYTSNVCCNTGGDCGPDCDDSMLNVHPMAPELCNGIDDDCDGRIDEGLPPVLFYPDCDMDGYGDASATPLMSCTTPVGLPTCASGTGHWVMQAGDCADTNPMRHMGATEACNGVDDDCDMLVDDIIHGTVVCAAGQTRSCHNASCGTDGNETCADTCLAWSGRCVATEICNGCDDDGDGAPDNGFTCARGASQACTVPTCGTAGTQVCGATCGWGACTAPEVCNYCDDNGDGNFFEERPLAVNTSTDHFLNCDLGDYTLAGTHTACGTTGTGSGFQLWGTLIDGTSNNQAGAMWFSPSANWVQGWGPTEVSVDLEVTGVSAGGALEEPLGGWAVIIGHGGTVGVGTPQNRGIPATIDGVAASWFWSRFTTCTGGGYPPGNGDSTRFTRLHGGSIDTNTIPTTAGFDSDEGCYNGELVSGGSTMSLDGPGTTVVQHLTLRYTPDDPTVTGNQELVTITSGTGSGAITYTYQPSNDLPIGTEPLRIGITAGTYTQSGFLGPPAGTVVGVPVRARARIFTQTSMCCGAPTFDYGIPITRAGLCPG